MAKSPKFGVTIEKTGEKAFTARVVRRRTSRGTTIERERVFEDRLGAVAWGESALADYLAARGARRTAQKRHRANRREREAWLEKQTLQVLSRISDHLAVDILKYKADLLWQEVAFRALKRSEPEDTAIALANKVVGKNLTQRLAKAVSGDLDHVGDAVTDMAFANARRLCDLATGGHWQA